MRIIFKRGQKPGTTLSDRFWEKVDKTGDCWEWIAGKYPVGYGKIYVGGESKHDGAHRVSYRLNVGEIPEGMRICHTCDNHGCVRPSHLFAGTAYDNTMDMIRKGRNNPNPCRGETNPNSKLTDAEVLAIRLLYWEMGRTSTSLAKEFGVGGSQIFRIVKGESRVQPCA